MIIVSFSNLNLIASSDRKEIKDFTSFFLTNCMETYLNSKETYYIHIEICSKLNGEKGRCEVESAETKRGKYKEYLISIKKSKKIINLLETLGHELTHVRQYMSGQLNFGKDVNHSIWDGKAYDERKLSYWMYPWEIEAYGMERCMYELWRQNKK
jgi:hypothetical protein